MKGMMTMPTYDPQKAARVWQRVQAQKEEPARREGNLAALIMEERISAGTYFQLARVMQGKDAAELQRLAREEEAHAACLGGICHLITGEMPKVQVPPAAKEPAALTLRKCYGRQMHSLKEYEARSSDPEYGPVFDRLAEQEREHLRVVLEILGRLGKK